MILSKLKKKVLVLTVAGTMVLGTGVVFAAQPDAGANLKNWYYAVISNTVNPLVNTFDEYMGTHFASMTALANNGASTAATELTNYSKPATDASDAITSITDKHLSDIATTKTYLEDSYIPDTFTLYTNNSNAGYSKQITENAKKVVADVTSTVNTAGNNAVIVTNTNVTATKDEQVAKLTAAISAAKAELNELTATRAAQYVMDVEGNIDANIKAQYSEIAKLIIKLEAAQKVAIEKAATDVQTAAEAELSNAVNNALVPDYQW
jgi:hypothetical protein